MYVCKCLYVNVCVYGHEGIYLSERERNSNFNVCVPTISMVHLQRIESSMGDDINLNNKIIATGRYTEVGWDP